MKLNIRWRRVFVATVVLCGLGLATFAVRAVSDWRHDREEQRAAELHPHPANDIEQSEILRAVLMDEFYVSWLPAARSDEQKLNAFRDSPNAHNAIQKPPPANSIVLIDSSLVFCGQAPVEGRGKPACISSRDSDWATSFVLDVPGMPKKLLPELFALNRVSSLLPDPQSAAILYRSRAVIEDLFVSPDRWNRFEALFPHSYGAIEVSRAALSEDGSHALIYVQLWCIPYHADQGVLYYLVRTGNTWRIENVSGPSIV